METSTLNQDIKVFYITADSFPESVMAAHERLHALVPFSTERKYFGISRPENNGPIVYRAAAEELKAGEAEQFGCDTLVLKKGNYISRQIKNYVNDGQVIGRTFRELLQQPGLDLQGYCVEWYTNATDVTCMVRLA